MNFILKEDNIYIIIIMDIEILDINFLDYGQDDIYNALLQNIYEKINNNIEFKNFKDKKLTAPKVSYNSKIKRTVWENFVSNWTELDRNKDDIKKYLEKELLTQSSINQSNQLLIKGKYESEIIVRQYARYIREYVQCPSCKSYSTIFNKNSEHKLNNIRCTKCFSEKSVK